MSKSAISPQDEIWSLIKETQKNIKELRAGYKEFQVGMKELRVSQKETDRGMKELQAGQKEFQASQKETGDQIKEMSKEIKKAQNLFTTQWGRLMESLVEGDLVRLLKEKGVEIERTSANEKGLMSYIDEKGQEQQEECEIDIIAKNGREIVAVEVKTNLTVRGVRRFLDVLKRLTRMLPEYRDKKVYGAVAWLRSESGAHLFAERQGLFVIRATGDSASIINKESFKPKAFS